MEDIALKIKPSRDSLSETLSMLHPKRILRNKELSRIILYLSFISKCNIVCLALFTLELLKLDQLRIEELELPHKEFQEMLLENPSRKIKENELDFKKLNHIFII